MQEVFEKIMAILEAQDAKIKALEKQIEAYGGGFDTVLETVYSGADRDRFNAFSEKHSAKFAPYIGIMDKLEGGDSFRAIYERSLDMDGQDGYDEDQYVDGMLANVIETINALKEVVPPEVVPALEQAEAAIQEAAIENDAAEGLPPETIDDDEWSVENLSKEKLEGRDIF